MRLLSDYFERAGLRGVPANLLGMIEQVVISHGRTFTGTFYSSFSAHVFRHRLYLGKVRSTLIFWCCFVSGRFFVAVRVGRWQPLFHAQQVYFTLRTE